MNPLLKIIADQKQANIRTVEFTWGKLGAFYVEYDYYNDGFKEISVAAPGEKIYHVITYEDLDLGSQNAIEDVLFP